MGRKLKGGFKPPKKNQKDRLEKVSEGLLERKNNVGLDRSVLQLRDNSYSSRNSETELSLQTGTKSDQVVKYYPFCFKLYLKTFD